MRFYHLLRAGITWKGPEVIELWYKFGEMEKGGLRDDEISVLYDIEEETEENGDDSDDLIMMDVSGGGGGDAENEEEKSAASGSEEDDSLLVAYDSNSVGSVWQKLIVAVQKVLKLMPNHTEIYILLILFIEIYAQLVSLF